MTKTATQRETLSPDSLHNWAQELIGRESYLLIGAGFRPLDPRSATDSQVYVRTENEEHGRYVIQLAFPSATNGRPRAYVYAYHVGYTSPLLRSSSRYLLTYDDVMLAVRGMSNYNLFLRLEEKASE